MKACSRIKIASQGVADRFFTSVDPKRTSPRMPDVRFVLPERQHAKDIDEHDQYNACNVAFAVADFPTVPKSWYRDFAELERNRPKRRVKLTA